MYPGSEYMLLRQKRRNSHFGAILGTSWKFDIFVYYLPEMCILEIKFKF